MKIEKRYIALSDALANQINWLLNPVENAPRENMEVVHVVSGMLETTDGKRVYRYTPDKDAPDDGAAELAAIPDGNYTFKVYQETNAPDREYAEGVLVYWPTATEKPYPDINKAITEMRHGIKASAGTVYLSASVNSWHLENAFSGFSRGPNSDNPKISVYAQLMIIGGCGIGETGKAQAVITLCKNGDDSFSAQLKKA